MHYNFLIIINLYIISGIYLYLNFKYEKCSILSKQRKSTTYSSIYSSIEDMVSVYNYTQ